MPVRWFAATIVAATASLAPAIAPPPPPADDAGHRERRGFDFDGGERFRGSDFDRGPGQLPAVSDDTIIEVIRRLAPQMAESVERQLKDPAQRDAVRQKLLQKGRRFIGLAILRERQPKLYDAKISLLEIQESLVGAARDYHAAKQSESIEAMTTAEARLREVASRSVQAELLTDGLELQALEDYLLQQREELKRETSAEEVKSRADAVIADLLAQDPGDRAREAVRNGQRGGPRPAPPRPRPPAMPPPDAPGGGPPERPPEGVGQGSSGAAADGPMGDARAGGQGDGFGPEFGRPRGRFPKVSDESLLEVIKRLAPQMATELARDLNDPKTHDDARNRLFQSGRRFVGLAILRDRNPRLYEAKVAVLEAQEEGHQASHQFHDAKARGNTGDMQRFESQIRQSVARAIQLDVLAQALELQAMDEYLCQQREDLKRRASDDGVRTRVDALVMELKEREPRRPDEIRRSEPGRPDMRDHQPPPEDDPPDDQR
ncbi:MAG: hypothetical protein U0572_02535 [Phycisphaerales bacterium]